MQQQGRLLRQRFHAGCSYLHNLDRYEAAAQAYSYARSTPGPSAPFPSDWPYFTSEWGGAGSAWRDTRRDWALGQPPLGLGAPPDGEEHLRLPTAYMGSRDELWSRDGEGTLFGQEVPAQQPRTTRPQRVQEEAAQRQPKMLRGEECPLRHQRDAEQGSDQRGQPPPSSVPGRPGSHHRSVLRRVRPDSGPSGTADAANSWPVTPLLLR